MANLTIMNKKTTLSPQEATSYKKLQTINNNIITRNYWMFVKNNYVTIVKEKDDVVGRQVIEIPRKDFNKLIKFYTTKQKING